MDAGGTVGLINEVVNQFLQQHVAPFRRVLHITHSESSSERFYWSAKIPIPEYADPESAVPNSLKPIRMVVVLDLMVSILPRHFVPVCVVFKDLKY